MMLNRETRVPGFESQRPHFLINKTLTLIMIKLSFLGGAGEVGRSAIILDNGIERFLLDYGIEVQHSMLPILPDVDINAILITHAHLDHSAMMPELYKRGYSGYVYATKPTFDLCSLLLPDLLKVQKKKGLSEIYLDKHINMAFRKRKIVENDSWVDIGTSTLKFIHAGHIPGSSSILIESKNKRVLYTGDIKFIDTKLMKGAKINEKCDILISEATYAYIDHPNRKELENKLKNIVSETVLNGGICLIASFAVGRAQEMAIILKNIGVPVFIDGMAIDATQLTLKNPESVRNVKELQDAISRAGKIKNVYERRNVLKDACVIITTSGMLNGGPVSFYMRELIKNERCTLILTGYQVEGTVGRKLLDTGVYEINGIDIKPKMRIEFLDFSAHTDRTHLLKFYKKISPEKILLVHTDHGKEFKEEVKEEGFDVDSPKNGDIIVVGK